MPQHTISRTRVARDVYEVLVEDPPPGAISVDEPDDLGCIGIRYDDGYVLLRVEVTE